MEYHAQNIEIWITMLRIKSLVLVWKYTIDVTKLNIILIYWSWAMQLNQKQCSRNNKEVADLGYVPTKYLWLILFNLLLLSKAW